jgi:hypothetical protein
MVLTPSTFHAEREVEFTRPCAHDVPMTRQNMLYHTDVREALLKAIVEWVNNV